jgi:uncharacterized membrane-anchored protein YjiN (DUF445 family)
MNASESDKSGSLRRMQGVATGCVAAALAIRIGAAFLPDSTWVGYLRAFSDAAVVGGMADWFAVTALFRHPLGLKIPHTRILPRSKSRIGASLSDFVVSNFLSREVVERELLKIDLSAKGAEFLEARAEPIATRVTMYLPRFLEALNDEDISRFLQTQVTDRLRKVSLAPMAGRIVELLTSGDKHERIVDDLLGVAEGGLKENRDVFTEMIRKEIPVPDSLGLPGLPIAVPLGAVKDKLASKIADEAMKRILTTITEVRGRPDHEIRKRIRDRIARFAADLKESPDMLARGEEIRNEFLANPHVGNYAGQIWSELKVAIKEDTLSANSQIRSHLAAGLHRAAVQVKTDHAMREKFNMKIRSAALEIIESNAPQFGRMIEETIARWDGNELSRKLELEVGRDLQFVRINGTLVGGLLGLALHALVSLF